MTRHSATRPPPHCASIRSRSTLDGVAQDDARAFTLFEAAARQGHDGAVFNLATMYRDGRGTARDPGAAVKGFVAAARAGQVEAFHELARIALAEEAPPENLVLAHMWLLQAHWADDADADADLERVAAQLTPEQRARAERFAQEFR